MQVVYSRARTPLAAGRRFHNPRFFKAPVEGATVVLLTEDLPDIARAYEALGVCVLRVDAEGNTIAPAFPVPVQVPVGLCADPAADVGAVFIPDDWRDLPWSGKTDAGITLRALAAMVSPTPVINKHDAMTAIEAELLRRAALLTESAQRADEAPEGDGAAAFDEDAASE